MIFTADLEIECETKRELELVLQKIESETNLVWLSGSKPASFVPLLNRVIHIGFDYITCSNNKTAIKDKRIKAKQII